MSALGHERRFWSLSQQVRFTPQEPTFERAPFRAPTPDIDSQYDCFNTSVHFRPLRPWTTVAGCCEKGL